MTKSRQAYPVDLYDIEWSVIAPYLPGPRMTGRPRENSWWEILNAIFYIQRSGCAWRMMPHDFPSRQTVYQYFHIRQKDGTWERFNAQLRTEHRVVNGRDAYPVLRSTTRMLSKSQKLLGSAATFYLSLRGMEWRSNLLRCGCW